MSTLLIDSLPQPKGRQLTNVQATSYVGSISNPLFYLGKWVLPMQYQSLNKSVNWRKHHESICLMSVIFPSSKLSPPSRNWTPLWKKKSCLTKEGQVYKRVSSFRAIISRQPELKSITSTTKKRLFSKTRLFPKSFWCQRYKTFYGRNLRIFVIS